MGNPNEVQPIDGYVKQLLETVAKGHRIPIDLDRPTRAQRLEAALAIENESNGWYSMEIMVGRRVDSNEPFAMTFTMLKMAKALGRSDSRKFYDDFAHQYWPKDAEKSSAR